MTLLIVLLSILCFILVGALWYVCVRLRILTAELYKTKQDLDLNKESAQKSLKTSKSVINGQIMEQIYPLLADCPFKASEMKFFGQPFDYVVLKGYEEGFITEVVFVELKTGSARLSTVQRSLRDAITNGRVSWYEARVHAAKELEKFYEPSSTG